MSACTWQRQAVPVLAEAFALRALLLTVATLILALMLSARRFSRAQKASAMDSWTSRREVALQICPLVQKLHWEAGGAPVGQAGQQAGSRS